MSEEWRTVYGFEGGYEVSSHGRVRSIDRAVVNKCGVVKLLKGKILRPGIASNGYPSVALGRGSTKMIHALVACAFIGPCPVGQEVRHKDGDRKNPARFNLEYGTRGDNMNDAKKHGTLRGGTKPKFFDTHHIKSRAAQARYRERQRASS